MPPPVLVRVAREFEASPERVFDAWLDPDLNSDAGLPGRRAGLAIAPSRRPEGAGGREFGGRESRPFYCLSADRSSGAIRPASRSVAASPSGPRMPATTNIGV
jgi:hypothetical protein